VNTSNYFISGDWGTTNFRLRVVNSGSLEVITELKTDCGVKPHYQKYLKQSQKSQFEFFSDYLLSQIEQLPEKLRNNPVVLSGMASANIGMQELPYTDLPFSNTGKELITELISLPDNLNLILISGAKTKYGMMRGEETQALGMMDHLEKYEDGILILPGTHSKHITYNNKSFTDLETFMTGELFALLSKQSILENNLETCQWDKEYEEAFLGGVKNGLNKEMTSNLFRLRANDLLGYATKQENYYMLSGLLIGDELSYLVSKNKRVFLAANESTLFLYQLAALHFLPADKVVIFDSTILDNALLLGQQKILSLYGS